MQKNVASRIGSRAKDAVGFIGIADMKAQIEIALRIEPVQFIKSFGHLFVAKSSFWTETSRSRADRIGLQQGVRFPRRILDPKFQLPFLFEGPEEHHAWRISNTLVRE